MRIVAKTKQWVVQRWVVQRDKKTKELKPDSEGNWTDSTFFSTLEHAARSCADQDVHQLVKEEGLAILGALKKVNKTIRDTIKETQDQSGKRLSDKISKKEFTEAVKTLDGEGKRKRSRLKL